MEHETFFTLLQNPAHWEFELFLMFVFDVALGMVLMPCFKRATKHHKKDDKKIDELERQVKEIKKLLAIELAGKDFVKRSKEAASKLKLSEEARDIFSNAPEVCGGEDIEPEDKK